MMKHIKPMNDETHNAYMRKHKVYETHKAYETRASGSTPSNESPHPKHCHIEVFAESGLCLTFLQHYDTQTFQLAPEQKRFLSEESTHFQFFSRVQFLCFCVQRYLFLFMAIIRSYFLTGFHAVFLLYEVICGL